ncbi:MAG: 50S ribosomal protein L10 [archaeon]
MRTGEVKEWKKKKVEEIKNKIEKFRTIGIIDLRNYPSDKLQEIRKKLRGKAEIFIDRIEFINRALKEKNITIMENVNWPVALLLSNENAYKIYSIIKKEKGKAPAKAGQISPIDIIVPAGETDIPAGPTLAELKALKVDVKLDKGKIVVASDSKILETGKMVTPQIAAALAKLNILPFEITMKIYKMYEDGIVFDAETLDFDEVKAKEEILKDYSHALALATKMEIPVGKASETIISNAYRKALSLALELNILTKETIPFILMKKNLEAQLLKQKINI